MSYRPAPRRQGWSQRVGRFVVSLLGAFAVVVLTGCASTGVWPDHGGLRSDPGWRLPVALGSVAAPSPDYRYDPAAGATTPTARVAFDATNGDLSPAVDDLSLSTLGHFLATEEGAGGLSFFRGARPGEEPSFEPRPNEFKVDPATGYVRPTHGVSVFDNPFGVSSKGFDPSEVDQSSVPDTLQIIQRGQDPAHYEITPAPGSDQTPEEYGCALSQIRCVGQ
jgi:hypothetical protein